MKEYEYLDELISRYPVLAPVKADIRTAYETMKECYERGGKLLIAGNGGSCADSEHIVGELMKGFVKKRLVSAEIEAALKTVDPQMGAELSEKLQQGLPAIALTGHAGLTTAFMNDVDGTGAWIWKRGGCVPRNLNLGQFKKCPVCSRDGKGKGA